MTLYKALTVLSTLDQMKSSGGKTYKQINKLLNAEATTYNLELAEQLLFKLNGPELTESDHAKIRAKHGVMKPFSSGYSGSDLSLPHIFDLLYDIKSEAHLLKAMIDGEDFHSISDINRTAYKNGYSLKYLQDKYNSEPEG